MSIEGIVEGPFLSEMLCKRVRGSTSRRHDRNMWSMLSVMSKQIRQIQGRKTQPRFQNQSVFSCINLKNCFLPENVLLLMQYLLCKYPESSLKNPNRVVYDVYVDGVYDFILSTD